MVYARSGKKCAVFAQFWEAVGSKTSHMTIDYQYKAVQKQNAKKTEKFVLSISSAQPIVRAFSKYDALFVY